MEKLFERLISDAISHEITDLHFKSFYEPLIEQRYRGKLMPFEKLPLDTYQKMIRYLQFKANIDLNHHLQPQTGSFQWKKNQNTYYFRLSYLPSVEDIHLVLRILNHQRPILLIDLCDNKSTFDDFKKLISKQSGMIIVSGPTGSGKSTTLHAFLQEISQSGNKNIITVEDPIEIHHSNMVQIQIDEKKGISFNQALIQILRHDPDVVMIGEIRDEMTAAIAMRLALTGHLVLTTIHASNVKSTIIRLENLGLLQDDLNDVLRAVISQRLVYSKNRENPYCFFEIASKESLRTLIENHKVQYLLMDELLIAAVNNNWVTYEEIEPFLIT